MCEKVAEFLVQFLTSPLKINSSIFELQVMKIVENPPKLACKLWWILREIHNFRDNLSLLVVNFP